MTGVCPVYLLKRRYQVKICLIWPSAISMSIIGEPFTLVFMIPFLQDSHCSARGIPPESSISFLYPFAR